MLSNKNVWNIKVLAKNNVKKKMNTTHNILQHYTKETKPGLEFV